MYKKTLLSLAVASTVGLSGCFSDGGNKNGGATTAQAPTQAEQGTYPVFNPVTNELPIPNDLLLTDNIQTDGSFSVDIGPADEGNPVLEALNGLSGASTVAPFDIAINGQINPDTVLGPTEATIASKSPTVFLFKLEYSEGSTAANLVTPPDNLSLVSDIQVSVETFDNAAGRDTQYIRVSPTVPLDPNERYSVVVTKGIQDDEGNPITSSPSFKTLLRDEPIAGQLGGAQGIVKLWAGTASAPASIDQDDVALAYNFTTSPDRQVLNYIANPVSWMNTQLVAQGGDPMTAGETSDFLSLAEFPDPDARNVEFFNIEDYFGNEVAGVTGKNPLAVSAATALAGFSPSTPPNVNVHQGEITLPYYLGIPEGDTGNAQESGSDIKDVSWRPNVNLAQQIVGFARSELGVSNFGVAQADPETSKVLNYRYPFPKKTGEFDVPMLAFTPNTDGQGNTVSNAQAALNASGRTYEAVIFQHGITSDRSAALAYASSLVDNYSGSADGLVVFAIDQPLHGVGPSSLEGQRELTRSLIAANNGSAPEDVPQSLVDTVVNGQFPEYTVGEIASNGCSEAAFGEDGNPRTFEEAAKNVLDYPGNTTEQCGAPAAGELETAFSLDGTVANQGSSVPGLAPTSTEQGVVSNGTTERHFGYGSNALSELVYMNFDPANPAGASGDNFINLSDFLVNRDNLRQGVVDLLNLRKTIANFDAVSNVYFVGHSLGGLNGATFSAVATGAASADPQLAISGAHLLAPASGVTRLLENSPSFAPEIVPGLASNGLDQDDANYQTFLNVFQHAIDSVDPVNFTPELSGLSNVLIGQVDGDLTVPNAAVESDNFLIGSNPNLADNPPLDVQVSIPLADGTVVNRIQSSPSPLAGTEQFARLLGANAVTGSGTALPAIKRHAEGAHSTPVLPRAVEVEKGDIYRDGNGDFVTAEEDGEATIVDSGNAGTTYNLMYNQTLDLIQGGGIDNTTP